MVCAVEHRVKKQSSPSKEAGEIRKGQGCIMNHLICQVLNIFLKGAGKPQKPLSARYGMADERRGQLGTAAVQVRDGRSPATAGATAIRAAIRGPLKRVCQVW